MEKIFISSEQLEEFQGNFQDMAYDNIKCHKKPGHHPFSRRYVFRKTAGGGGGRKLGLSNYLHNTSFL